MAHITKCKYKDEEMECSSVLCYKNSFCKQHYLENVEKQLEDLKKDCLELANFYGNRRTYSIDYGDDLSSMRSFWILYGDSEEINDCTRYAGARARKFLEKWNDK